MNFHHLTRRQSTSAVAIARKPRNAPPSPLNGERAGVRGESANRRQHNENGITLIECLVYISLVFVVLGLATAAFYRCFDNMKALRRNTDDITQALHAGELWRADIRAATKPVQFDAADQLLRITHRDREVAYKFADAQVLRRTGADTSWVVVLPKVEKSQMQADTRAQVTAWQWELELKTLRKPATMRPLFTFTAVPNPTGTP
jgi:type II secretory pathway component PulJ